MTKRHILIVLVLLLTGILYLIYHFNTKQLTLKTSSGPQSLISKKDPIKLEIDGKKVIGLSPGREREEIEKLVVRNHPSPEWENELEENLKLQGGSAIKDIVIEKESSFIWLHEGTALHVETAKITLKNQQNEISTFRVMVDAQNGKILQNWDPPVIDRANSREQFRLKLDPRYHNHQ